MVGLAGSSEPDAVGLPAGLFPDGGSEKNCWMFPRLILGCWLLISAAVPAVGFPFPAVISTDEIAADRVEAEYLKFLQAFRRRPRPGVSLDRILEHHRAQGSLSQFAAELEQQLEDQPAAADAALLGFVQQQLGAAERSLRAFIRAGELSPQEPVFAWMRGRQLNRLGRSNEAAEVMLPLLAERLPITDLMAIGRDLNSALRASGRSADLPAVWQQIEQSAGDNLRILEQTAWILRGEGLLSAAAERFRRIAAASRDPEDALAAALRVAELMLEMNQGAAAKADLQSQLERVLPDSWQAGEIRQLLEDCLRQESAATDLLGWYTELTERWPDSVTIPQRHVQLLDQAGKADAADRVLEQAMERLPSRVALVRLQIVRQQKRGQLNVVDSLYERLQQRELLTNSDLRDWGQLQLQRGDLSDQQQRERALEIWNKLIQRSGADRAEQLLVAELLQQAGMPVEAETIYERLLQVDAQDRELLTQYGEFLLLEEKQEAAAAIWSRLVEGDAATRENRLFLSELLETHGMREQAIAVLREVCQEGTEVADALRLVRLLLAVADRDEQLWEETDTLLRDAADVAETTQQREQVQEVWLRVILESGRWQIRVRELEAEISDATDEDGERMLQLALLLRELGDIDAAIRWAEAATLKSETRERAAGLMAELCDRAGDLGRAVDALTILLEEGTSRSRTLVQIAELQLRLGRRREAADSALQAAEAAGERIADLRAAIGVLQQADAVVSAVRFLEQRQVAERGPDELAVDLAYLLVQIGERGAAEDILWGILGRAGAAEFPEALLPLLLELSGTAVAEGTLSVRVEELLARSRQSAALTRLLVQVLEARGDQEGAVRLLRRQLQVDSAGIADQLALMRKLQERGELIQAEELLAGISAERLSAVQQNQLMELLILFPQSGVVDDQLLNLVRISSDGQHAMNILKTLFEQQQWERVDRLISRLPARVATTWEIQFLQGMNAVCGGLSNADRGFRGFLQSSYRPISTAEQRLAPPGELQVLPAGLDRGSLQEWRERWQQALTVTRNVLAGVRREDGGYRPPASSVAARILALLVLHEQGQEIPAEFVSPDEILLSQRLADAPITVESLLNERGFVEGVSGVLLFAILLDADRQPDASEQRPPGFSAAVVAKLLRILVDDRPELAIADQRHILEWLRKRADRPEFVGAVRRIVDDQSTQHGDLLAFAMTLDGQRATFLPLLSKLRIAVEQNNSSQLDSQRRQRTADEIDECLLLVMQTSEGAVEPEDRLEVLRLWGMNLPGRESALFVSRYAAAAPASVSEIQNELMDFPGAELITGLEERDREFLVFLPRESAGSASEEIAAVLLPELRANTSRSVRQLLLCALLELSGSDPELQLQALSELAEVVGETWGIQSVRLQILCEQGEYKTAASIVRGGLDSQASTSAARWLKTLEIAFLADDRTLADQASVRLEGLQLTQEQQRAWVRGMRLTGQVEQYQSIVERRRTATDLSELQLQLDELNLAVAEDRNEDAVQLASAILQRPIGAGAIRVRNRRDQLDLELRTRAREVMQSAGEDSSGGNDQ